MQKRLFLLGPSGSGKSQLIRSVLGDKLSMAGGLVTRPLQSASGSLLGFALLPPAALAGVTGLESRMFLSFAEGMPQHDNEVYRQYGTQLLEEAVFYPFAVLDEIGGFELIIPQFRKALEDLLNADLPILGAMKTQEEAELYRQYLGIGERFSLQSQRLYEALEADADTLILPMEEGNPEATAQLVRAWAAQYVF